jgi:hypothetical protein
MLNTIPSFDVSTAVQTTVHMSKMAGVTRGASGSHRVLVVFVLLDLLFSVFVDRCLSFCHFSFGYCS